MLVHFHGSLPLLNIYQISSGGLKLLEVFLFFGVAKSLVH